MNSIIEQLQSKKFRGMLIGIGTVIAVQLGMDEAAANALIPWLTGIVCAYIAGQGLADIGKGKAQLDMSTLISSASGLLGGAAENKDDADTV